MKDSLLKLFSSVRLVEEVSRPLATSPQRSLSTFSPDQHNSIDILFAAEHIMPLTVLTPSASTESPLSYVDLHFQQPFDSAPILYDSADTITLTAQPNLATTPFKCTSNRRHPRLMIDANHLHAQEQTDRNESTGWKLKTSQTLLCLWPLPVLTRSTLLLSALVSILNATLWIPLTCSSPKLVLFRWEIILSPFLFDFDLQNVLLFGWNILILGLLEASLSPSLGGSRSLGRIVSAIVFTVCALHQGLGWALATLFSSDEIHECNQGLAPFLFALLMIQSANMDDKYMLINGNKDDDTLYKLTIRKVFLQLIMLLVNCMVKNILWWSLTGLAVGYVATILIQMTWLLRDDTGYYHLIHPFKDQEQGSTDGLGEKTNGASWNGCLNPTERIPHWRILWSVVKGGTVMMMITLSLLLLFNSYYIR